MSDRQPRTQALIDENRALLAQRDALREALVASRGPDLAGLRKALERFVSLTDGWGPALDPASPWMEAYQQGRAALQAGATEPSWWATPEDFDRMTPEQFDAVIEGSGFADRIREALAEGRAGRTAEPPSL